MARIGSVDGSDFLTTIREQFATSKVDLTQMAGRLSALVKNFAGTDAEALVKELMDDLAKGVGDALLYQALKDAGFTEAGALANDEIGFMTVAEGVEGKAFAIITKDGRKLLVTQDTHPDLFNQMVQARHNA